MVVVYSLSSPINWENGVVLSANERLIVALDSSKANDLHLYSEVLATARLLSAYGVVVKLNTAIHACGYSIIEDVQNHCPVFADLKFVDTRDTIMRYARAIELYKPRFLTVMSSLDDITVIKEIVGKDTIVLAVSVLTDMADSDVREVYKTKHHTTVVRLSERALRRGADGIIALPHDIAHLRKHFGDDLEIVCPGIRPLWYSGLSGHTRTMSPLKAIQQGATRLIVGRPITESGDIAQVISQIIAEIDSALT